IRGWAKADNGDAQGFGRNLEHPLFDGNGGPFWGAVDEPDSPPSRPASTAATVRMRTARPTNERVSRQAPPVAVSTAAGERFNGGRPSSRPPNPARRWSVAWAAWAARAAPCRRRTGVGRTARPAGPRR